MSAESAISSGPSMGATASAAIEGMGASISAGIGAPVSLQGEFGVSLNTSVLSDAPRSVKSFQEIVSMPEYLPNLRAPRTESIFNDRLSQVVTRVEESNPIDEPSPFKDFIDGLDAIDTLGQQEPASPTEAIIEELSTSDLAPVEMDPEPLKPLFDFAQSLTAAELTADSELADEIAGFAIQNFAEEPKVQAILLTNLDRIVPQISVPEVTQPDVNPEPQTALVRVAPQTETAMA